MTNTYDGVGRLISQQDAAGHAWTWYVAGSRTEIDSPVGAQDVSYYDQRGNLTGSIDPVGNLTSYTYDGLSRLSGLTLPSGISSTYQYDSFNNVIQETDASAPFTSGSTPNQHLFKTISRSFDPVFNVPTSVTDADGIITDAFIDPTTGTVSSTKGGRFPITSPGRITCLGNSSIRPTSCFTYNANGQVVNSVGPIGEVTSYTYNATGDLTSATIDPGALGTGHFNLVNSFEYDVTGNRISATTPYGKTSFTYDANRRLSTITPPYESGEPVLTNVIARDDLGRVTSVTRPGKSGSPAIPQVMSSTYTPTGQVATSTDASGRVSTNTYDLADRLVATADGEQRTVSIGYDADSRIANICKFKGAVTSGVPCVSGTPATVETRNYTADSLLRGRTHYSGGAGHTTTYIWSVFDRLGKVIYLDGTYEDHLWTLAGDMVSYTSRAGQTTTWTYESHRVQTKSGVPVVDYRYDVAGRPLSAQVSTAAGGVPAFNWTWTYDTIGRRISSTQPAGTLGYTLDKKGTPYRKVYPDGMIYEIYRNSRQEPAQGLLKTPDLTSTTIWGTSHDAFNRPTVLKYYAGSTNPTSNLTYDNAGTGLDVVDILNKQANGQNEDYKYAFDRAHRVMTQTVATGTPLAHPSTGNTLAGLTATADNEVLNGTGTLRYTAQNSELSGDGARTYSYDPEGAGRLLSATQGATSASYQYDPFGRRIQKTVGGVTTRYLLDEDGTEVGEYDSSNRLLRRLLYHPEFTAPVVSVDASGAMTFAQFDRLGSVVATITGSTGVLANSYSYLPYGDTASGSISGTAFGFAGYRYDAETGTYHTATRSYDPRLGRFLQPDPIRQGGGLNIYAYADGDPANGTDPSGLAPGDGPFRDGQAGSGPQGLGGSQSPGGVGQGGSGNGGGGGGGQGRGTNPTVAGPITPIVQGGVVISAQFVAPPIPFATPIPPVAVPYSPENEDFVRSFISAFRHLGDFVRNIFHNEPEAPDPQAGNLKAASEEDLKKAAAADGYSSVEAWKQQELQLNSKSQIYRDPSGRLYSGPRRGTGPAQPLGVTLP